VYWVLRPRVKDRILSYDFESLARRSMPETAESPPSFEASLAELEALVGRMESGELPLRESLAAYKRGAELLAYCQAALKDAQQQVQVFEKGVLQPFSTGDADDA
jgi:exodeoxyribonuclease VII small subunit